MIEKQPLNPSAQSIDQQAVTTLQEVKLGGEKTGGTFSLSVLDAEPIVQPDGSNTIKMGNIDGELKMLIKPAGDIGLHTFGLVTARLVGNHEKDDNVLLVQLSGDSESGYQPIEDDKGNPVAIDLGAQETISIGRRNSSQKALEKYVGLDSDSSMSAGHLDIVRNNGFITVIDKASTNGTTIQLMKENIDNSSETEGSLSNEIGDVALEREVSVDVIDTDEKSTNIDQQRAQQQLDHWLSVLEELQERVGKDNWKSISSYAKARVYADETATRGEEGRASNTAVNNAVSAYVDKARQIPEELRLIAHDVYIAHKNKSIAFNNLQLLKSKP